MSHSKIIYKRDYDRLNTKFENYQQRYKTWNSRARNLLKQINRKDEKIENLNNRLAAAKKDLNEKDKVITELTNNSSAKQNTKIAKHHYGLLQVILFIELYIRCNVSLHSCERSIGSSFKTLDIYWDAPNWKTGKTWIMKLGYYKLHNIKVDKHLDWVWMMDHSIQLGDEKSFLVLGIRKTSIPIGRALCAKDMTVLHMSFMKKSTGEIINQILEDLSKSLEIIPRQIISDEGGDVKKGACLFAKKHTKTIVTYDLKHKIANWYKRNIGTDGNWKLYVADSAKFKKQVQQTSLSYLCPPTMKTKARYMNLPELTYWGSKSLNLLKHIYPNEDNELIHSKLSWLSDYEENLKEYAQIHDVAKVMEIEIRNYGITKDSANKINKDLEDHVLTPLAHSFKAEIIEFIRQQGVKLRKEERILGSTEIIESIFGHLKMFSAQHSKSGFTSMSLAIPALVGDFNTDDIEKALTTVKNSDVKVWCKKNISRSIQGDKNKLNKWLGYLKHDSEAKNECQEKVAA
jgi:hypothetical protein